VYAGLLDHLSHGLPVNVQCGQTQTVNIIAHRREYHQLVSVISHTIKTLDSTYFLTHDLLSRFCIGPDPWCKAIQLRPYHINCMWMRLTADHVSYGQHLSRFEVGPQSLRDAEVDTCNRLTTMTPLALAKWKITLMHLSWWEDNVVM